MNTIKINIAICTWNRSALLEETLLRLTHLIIPEQTDLKVIIINNNCTDNTEDIISSFKNRLPLISVFEKKPGLSNARNKAIEVADGDYIIWTDDDVLVDPNWLASYRKCFIEHPDIDVFGGPVLPYYEKTPPNWLVNSIEVISDAFALRNLGSETIPLRARSDDLPFGANYAIKVQTQKLYHYSPELGRQPGNLNLLGEETLVINKILESGKRGLWVPDAIVNHRIPSERQTLKYISNYFIGKGESIGYIPNRDDKLLFGTPIWLLIKIVKLHAQLLVHRVFCNDQIWIETLKKACLNYGFIKSIK